MNYFKLIFFGTSVALVNFSYLPNLMLWLLLLIFLIVCFKSMVIGLAVLIVIFPFSNLIFDIFNLELLKVFIFFYILLGMLIILGRISRDNLIPIYFLFVFTVVAYSFLITFSFSSDINHGLILLLSFIMSVLFVAVALYFIRDAHDVTIVYDALIIACMLGLISAFYFSSGEYSRFVLHEEGGGVRSFANALSLGILGSIFRFGTLFSMNAVGTRSDFSGKPVRGQLLFLLIYSIALFGVLLSVSRAVFFSFLLILAIVYIQDFSVKVNRGRIGYTQAISLFIIFSIFLLFPLMTEVAFDLTQGGVDRFTRFNLLDPLSDPSGLTRFIVLSDFISNNSKIAWLIGNGLGGFYKFNRLGLYEHSAFLSLLFSFGIFGVFTYAIVLVRLARYARQKRRMNIFLIILLFQILLFMTHGTITALYFWLYFLFMAHVSLFPATRGILRSYDDVFNKSK
jgi:hypothetical protein